MNRSNISLLVGFILIALVWFFWSNPRPEPVAIEDPAPKKKVIKTKPEALIKNSPKPSKVKADPSKKKPIKKAQAQTNKSNDFKLFREKLKNEAFIKIIDNVALTGGDQIVGFVDEGESFDAEKFYKTKVKESLLWSNSLVPFGYEKGFPRELKDRVEWAMAYFNQETGVRFVEFDETQDEDGVVFSFKSELPCSSFVGRIGGLQQIFLNFDCGTQSILHEMMHTLGFVHEQQLPFRDSFVDILWSNIEEESLHNFAEAPEIWTKHYQSTGSSFDYESVMIYNDQAFAKPGAKSMASKTDQLISPTQQGLSKNDLERINVLY